MNSERGSVEPGTLLIVACIVGFFILAVVFAARSNTKQAALLREFSRSQGWAFSLTDTQGLSAQIDTFFPNETFSLNNLMTVETGGRRLHLFECGYHFRKNRRSSSYGTGCLIESGRFQLVRSHFEITERTALNAATLIHQVALDEGEFAQLFIMTARDSEAAKAGLSPALQQALVTHRQARLFNPVRLSFTDKGAVLLTGPNAEPERWLDLVALARSLETSLP